MPADTDLTAGERAELAQLRDLVKRMIVFDGGAEIMSHQDMHRFHQDEPYIGCLFCRYEFVARNDILVWLAARAGEAHLANDKPRYAALYNLFKRFREDFPR